MRLPAIWGSDAIESLTRNEVFVFTDSSLHIVMAARGRPTIAGLTPTVRRTRNPGAAMTVFKMRHVTGICHPRGRMLDWLSRSASTLEVVDYRLSFMSN